jgi:hypothetical protein
VFFVFEQEAFLIRSNVFFVFEQEAFLIQELSRDHVASLLIGQYGPSQVRRMLFVEEVSIDPLRREWRSFPLAGFATSMNHLQYRRKRDIAWRK